MCTVHSVQIVSENMKDFEWTNFKYQKTDVKIFFCSPFSFSILYLLEGAFAYKDEDFQYSEYVQWKEKKILFPFNGSIVSVHWINILFHEIFLW